MNNYNGKYRHTVADIEFCHKAFNKSYILSQHTDWKLPEVDQPPLFSSGRFEIDGLQKLQDSLFQCKSQLNTFKREEWRLHTKKRNLVASLMYAFRSEGLTELAIQSWFKIWEILYKYEVIPEDCDSLTSVHLCEAPGAFVTALNHFLKQNRPKLDFDWLATSVNPYFEDFDPLQVINDDRIIQHTLDKWVFGPDNSGNIFNPMVVKELLARTEFKEVLLITADGSQENTKSSELVVIDLLYAEAITALKVLSKGGNFVIKIFTTFECPTINLVYLLCCAFEQVHMFKPVSSREATSEVYLICKGYRFGRDDQEFQAYLKAIETGLADDKEDKLAMFPLESLPKDFLLKLENAMKYFVALQEDVINANIRSFPSMKYPHEWNRRKFIRDEIAQRFRKLYPVEILTKAQRLCPYVEAQLEKFEVDNNYQGSWEDEFVAKVQMTNEELKNQLRHEFQVIKYSFDWPFMENEEAIKWTTDEDFRRHVKIIRGAEIKNIRNSRFINKRLLNFFHKVVMELSFEQLPESVGFEQTGPDHLTLTLMLERAKESLRGVELQFVSTLINYLGNVQSEGFTLEFKNVLLIGQRSVGLIYLMSKLLKDTDTQIKLSVCGGLSFSNLSPKTANLLVEELEKWHPLMNDDNLHSIVDIRRLRENQPDPFYDLIKIFNIHCCVQLLDKFFEH